MRRTLRRSLASVWTLFLLISASFRAMQVVAKGNTDFAVPTDVWVPGAFIGASILNLPDFVSVAVYLRLRWHTRKKSSSVGVVDPPADEEEGRNGSYFQVGHSSKIFTIFYIYFCGF